MIIAFESKCIRYTVLFTNANVHRRAEIHTPQRLPSQMSGYAQLLPWATMPVTYACVPLIALQHNVLGRSTAVTSSAEVDDGHRWRVRTPFPPDSPADESGVHGTQMVGKHLIHFARSSRSVCPAGTG